MKLHISQLNELLAKISSNEVKGLLLYGPNKGYIDKIWQLLAKKYDFLVATPPNHQTTNLSQLAMLLGAQNFFGKKELVKITNASNIFNHELRALLTTEFLNFAVFIADELPATAAIRKYFEQAANLVSIGCYYDDELLAKFINSKCQHKTLTAEALDFLKVNLSKDHKLVNNELDKLLAFVGRNQQITLKDTKQVISSNVEVSYHGLCSSFAEQKLAKFLSELANMTHHNINEISLIRALINYYLNLYLVLLKKENGEKLDLAIQALKPPIFFKYVADFKRIALQLSTARVSKVLLVLQQAEIKFKLNVEHFDFYQEVYVNAHL